LAYLGVKIARKASGWQVSSSPTRWRVILVLLDIHIPDEDGYIVLQRLRGDPRFKSTCIVAVTADASQESFLRAQAAGFDGFIGKPINPDEFPSQIKSILEGHPVWSRG
jgi:two-component system cell cycle response regulator DivK